VLQLVEVGDEALIGREPKVLDAQLIERGTERAHATTLRTRVRARCEQAHTTEKKFVKTSGRR
jgi:hypothetical protein